MKFNELIRTVTDSVSEEYGVSTKQVTAVVNALKETIIDAMVDGDTVAIPRFAKFEVVDVAARTAHNPRTGEKVEVPARKKVKVKVLSELKNSVL